MPAARFHAQKGQTKNAFEQKRRSLQVASQGRLSLNVLASDTYKVDFPLR
ncbi:hypothetical protein NHJ13734_002252 [Beauveria thailandica]